MFFFINPILENNCLNLLSLNYQKQTRLNPIWKTKKLTVVARIVAKPEHTTLVKSELIKLIEVTKLEVGLY